MNRSSTSLAVCLAVVQSVSCRRGSLAKLHAFARVRIVSSGSLAKQQKRKEFDQNLAEELPIAFLYPVCFLLSDNSRLMAGKW